MSQCVVLSVSSDVITFHRRVTARKRKREKTEGKGRATRYGKAERNRSRERDDKSVRNVPGPIKEEREIREGKAKNKKGGTGKWERVEKPQTTRSR